MQGYDTADKEAQVAKDIGTKERGDICLRKETSHQGVEEKTPDKARVGTS